MQRILGHVRRAVEKYNMINEGDKIAIGISGGKDSMLLAAALKAYQRFAPMHFDIIGININMGFEKLDINEVNKVREYFDKMEVEFISEPTNIAEVIFDIRKEANPCSLCAKMRRGALNSIAIQNGCNKIALGHHLDDIIETFFLSLFYEGRMSTFQPVSYMDRTEITLIRPFIYVEESDISSAIQRLNIPLIHNPCPQDKHTQREEIKKSIRDWNIKYKDSKKKIARAIFNPERNNLWPITELKK